MCEHGYCPRHIHHCDVCSTTRRSTRSSSHRDNVGDDNNLGTPPRRRNRRADDNNDTRRTFPINDYGDNNHLTKWEWYQFQCILFWETYPIGFDLPSPGNTHNWLKQPHGSPDFFTKEDVKTTLKKWKRFTLRYVILKKYTFNLSQIDSLIHVFMKLEITFGR